MMIGKCFMTSQQKVVKKLLAINLALLLFNWFIYITEDESWLQNIQSSLQSQGAHPRDHSQSSYLTDSSGNFTIHLFVRPSARWEVHQNRPSVYLSTQTSADKLYRVPDLPSYWKGFISIAVFSPGSKVPVAKAMIDFLQVCFPDIRGTCSFHLVYPRDTMELPGGEEYTSYYNCSDPQGTNERLVMLQESSSMPEVFPHNLLRNVARRSCPSTHTLVVDLDTIPSPDLSSKLENFLENLSKSQFKTIYVIPVYEVTKHERLPPSTKTELLKMVSHGKAKRWDIKEDHMKKGRDPVSEWEAYRSDEDVVKAMFPVSTYQEYWEPTILLPSPAPNFDERFFGHDFTMSSYVYHLLAVGREFNVLDNCFMTRKATLSGDPHPDQLEQAKLNKELHGIHVQELMARYAVKKSSSKKG